MGYYSDVSISLHKEDMVELVKRAKLECEEAFQLLTRGNFYDCGDDMVWTHSCVKWYIEYDEIRWVYHTIRSFKTYDFKRIGESYDDYEHESAYDDGDYWRCPLDELAEMERSFRVDGVDVNTESFVGSIIWQ